MNKAEVYKDSKGKLFENEKEYILNEAEIRRTMILKQWEIFTDVIQNKPENYYLFMKRIADSIIEGKTTKESLEKEYTEVMEIFKKEMKIKTDDYNNSGEQVEYEPRLWGNDCFEGGMDTWFD